MEFGSETEIRRIMNAESKEEAQRRSGGGGNSNKTCLGREEHRRGITDITNKHRVVIKVIKS